MTKKSKAAAKNAALAKDSRCASGNNAPSAAAPPARRTLFNNLFVVDPSDPYTRPWARSPRPST